MTDSDMAGNPRVVRWLKGWLASDGGQTAYGHTREAATGMLMLKLMRLKAAAIPHHESHINSGR